MDQEVAVIILGPRFEPDCRNTNFDQTWVLLLGTVVVVTTIEGEGRWSKKMQAPYRVETRTLGRNFWVINGRLS